MIKILIRSVLHTACLVASNAKIKCKFKIVDTKMNFTRNNPRKIIEIFEIF